jgi:hypothetical protein
MPATTLTRSSATVVGGSLVKEFGIKRRVIIRRVYLRCSSRVQVRFGSDSAVAATSAARPVYPQKADDFATTPKSSAPGHVQNR